MMGSSKVEFNTSFIADFDTEFKSVVTSAVSREEQEKSVDITENGTTTVVPDSGKILKKVTIVANLIPKLQEKIATANEEITADEGFDGLSKVIVDVRGNTIVTTDLHAVMIENAIVTIDSENTITIGG